MLPKRAVTLLFLALLAACQFEDTIAPIAWPTVGPEGVVQATVGPQASPIPVPYETPQASVTPEPFNETQGGGEAVGYMLLLGSEPPMWKVWYGGEVLYTSPDDPAEAALLTHFMLAAHNSSIESANRQAAEHSRNEAKGSVARGIAEIAIGGIVAAGSCATVPLTFWVMGGTGWVCAGSIALVGLGIWEVSAATNESNYQGEQYDDAEGAADAQVQEAQSAFEALKIYSDE